MKTLTVAIPEDAAARLNELARRDYRGPRQQAAVLLIEAIGRAGQIEPLDRTRDPVNVFDRIEAE